MITLRHLTKLSILLFAFVALPSQAQSKNDTANGTKMPELTQLQNLAKTAAEKKLPIMLMFGATYCEFCHTLRTEVLDPMTLSGLYEGQYLLMRHIVLDKKRTIPGFDGQPLSMQTWAQKINADLTPTTAFFDSTGKEIAPRIVGISNLEMYTALVHQRTNLALEKLNNPIRLPSTPEELQQQKNAR